jgi:hypothetical protein
MNVIKMSINHFTQAIECVFWFCKIFTALIIFYNTKCTLGSIRFNSFFNSDIKVCITRHIIYTIMSIQIQYVPVVHLYHTTKEISVYSPNANWIRQFKCVPGWSWHLYSAAVFECVFFTIEDSSVFELACSQLLEFQVLLQTYYTFWRYLAYHVKENTAWLL